MIELKNISCFYGKNTVLENINLKIPNHLTILGVNGSGKSTLAKTICDLIDYDGEIFMDEVNLKKLSLKQKAKNISYIPTKLEVYDRFISVDEFVLLGRFSHKESFFSYTKQDEKIRDESIKLLNITHLKNHTLNSLSSGEQQLALIASALSQQSRTIIFDEPTANLDPKNSKIIANHIKELKQNHNIILITHDLHLAQYIDNEIAFIQDKRLLHFQNDFFKESNLFRLYGVKFDGVEPQYD